MESSGVFQDFGGVRSLAAEGEDGRRERGSRQELAQRESLRGDSRYAQGYERVLIPMMKLFFSGENISEVG